MPRMKDTVPIVGSTFILDEGCPNCTSHMFESTGSDGKCVHCKELFLRGSSGYKKNIDRWSSSCWRYYPNPPQEATNF